MQIYLLQNQMENIDRLQMKEILCKMIQLNVHKNKMMCILCLRFSIDFLTPVNEISKREISRGQINIIMSLCMLKLSKAGFRLVFRSLLCHFAVWSSLVVCKLQYSAATPLWLYHRAALLPSWIEFNCLRSAGVSKVCGYRLIGKTLLTAWFSLCRKWHLGSCANITIKATMWWAASYSENSVRAKHEGLVGQIWPVDCNLRTPCKLIYFSYMYGLIHVDYFPQFPSHTIS